MVDFTCNVEDARFVRFVTARSPEEKSPEVRILKLSVLGRAGEATILERSKRTYRTCEAEGIIGSLPNKIVLDIREVQTNDLKPD
ncbi:MAG: hypothetical protein QW112_02440 [Candidatus Micrarchaeia archaeon]